MPVLIHNNKHGAVVTMNHIQQYDGENYQQFQALLKKETDILYYELIILQEKYPNDGFILKNGKYCVELQLGEQHYYISRYQNKIYVDGDVQHITFFFVKTLCTQLQHQPTIKISGKVWGKVERLLYTNYPKENIDMLKERLYQTVFTPLSIQFFEELVALVHGILDIPYEILYHEDILSVLPDTPSHKRFRVRLDWIPTNDSVAYFFKEPMTYQQEVDRITEHYLSYVCSLITRQSFVPNGYVNVGKQTIVLDKKEKIAYKKEMTKIVEEALSSVRSYYKTEYTFSNTTTSVYLTIKFKTVRDLKLNIRDHHQLKSTEKCQFKVIKGDIHHKEKLIEDIIRIANKHVKDNQLY